MFFCAFVFALLDRGQFDTSSVLVQGTGGAQCLPQAGRSGSVLTAGVGIKGTSADPDVAVPFRQKRSWQTCRSAESAGPKFPHVPYSGVPGSGNRSDSGLDLKACACVRVCCASPPEGFPPGQAASP